MLLKALVDGKLTTLPGVSCSFFFQETGSASYSIANALCSMIGQLCLAANEVVLPVVRKHWRERSKALLSNPTQLWKILVDVSEQMGPPTYCIIDALDESDKQSRDAFMAVANEYYRFQRDPPLRLLITARPYFDPQYQFNDLVDGLPESIIDLHKHFAAGRTYTIIDQRVETLRLPSECKDYLKTRLKQNQASSQSLLWLRAIFHQLQYDGKYRNASEVQIDRLITSTPLNDLFKLYDELLGSSDDPETAKLLLQVVIAKRFWTSNDLQVVLFYCHERNYYEQFTDKVLQNPEDFRTWTAPICGFFFEYDVSWVQLFHETALAYLQPEADHEPEVTGFRHAFTPRECHLTLLNASLCWLNDHHTQNHSARFKTLDESVEGPYRILITLLTNRYAYGDEARYLQSKGTTGKRKLHLSELRSRSEHLTDMSDECFWRMLYAFHPLRVDDGKKGGSMRPLFRLMGLRRMAWNGTLPLASLRRFFDANHKQYHFTFDEDLRSIFQGAGWRLSDCSICDDEGGKPLVLHCSSPTAFKQACLKYLGTAAKQLGVYHGEHADEFFFKLGEWYNASESVDDSIIKREWPSGTEEHKNRRQLRYQSWRLQEIM